MGKLSINLIFIIKFIIYLIFLWNITDALFILCIIQHIVQTFNWKLCN